MSRINYSLLGSGLRYPLTVNHYNGVLLNKDIDRINQSLFMLFETEKGSRLMQPRYGSSIDKYKFEPLDDILIDKLDYAIRQDVSEWEPRIILNDIKYKVESNDIDNSILYIMIYYQIRNTDINGNFVYPYRTGTKETLRKEVNP